MSSTNQLPDEATLLTKVIVGSKLHGLDNAKSDTDTRGIFIHDVKPVLSPFKKLKSNFWLEGGDEDDTAYELRHFIQMASHGNPTALEVLWSDKVIADTPAIAHLRANRAKLLDSKAIYEAHKGYASNQYNKMNFFDPDQRTPKFAVAFIRSLVQGVQLLETGTFKPNMADYNPELASFLKVVKYDFDNVDKKALLDVFMYWQTQLNHAYAANPVKYSTDVEWLEDYIYEVYVEKHGLKTIEQLAADNIDIKAELEQPNAG